MRGIFGGGMLTHMLYRMNKNDNGEKYAKKRVDNYFYFN